MNSGLIHWHGIEAADSFHQAVRQLRHSGVETLVMTKVDFEQLTLFWPEFYLSGPVLQLKEGWLRGILRKVFRKPRPIVKLRFSDEILEGLRVRFRDQKAIPVDGHWVPVEIWEETNEGLAEEDRQGTSEVCMDRIKEQVVSPLLTWDEQRAGIEHFRFAEMR